MASPLFVSFLRAWPIALYFEEVDNFKPVYPDNYKEIEKFVDLLDITIVNLKEANRSEKLKMVCYT